MLRVALFRDNLNCTLELLREKRGAKTETSQSTYKYLVLKHCCSVYVDLLDGLGGIATRL